MSGVLSTLLEMWFTHKCEYEALEGTEKNRDNQVIPSYADAADIPSCRLQDLTAEEIRSLTEDGVLNAAAKVLVPIYENPPIGSKIYNFLTNGHGVDGAEDTEVDTRIYEIVRSYVRRSTIDEFRQLILRRIG